MRDSTSTNSTTLSRPRPALRNPLSLPWDMTKCVDRSRWKRSSSVIMSNYIDAPVEVCFDLVAGQLQEFPGWDPIIKSVRPIAYEYDGVGSKSLVIFDLAGSVEEAITTVRCFVPNKIMMWTSDHSNQLQEKWEFKSAPDRTTVVLTLSYDPMGRGLFKYLTGWNQLHDHVDRAVSEMMGRLKKVAEAAVR